MMAKWNHAVCDGCWLEQEPARTPVRMSMPVIQYCGWCAQRTESGIYRRADPATVPYPDEPADARAYIGMFRRFTLPGTAFVDTSKRRIVLDRMTDSDAIFVAGEFKRMEAEAARRAMKKRAAPERRLRLS
jgi:hypothetical protein